MLSKLGISQKSFSIKFNNVASTKGPCCQKQTKLAKWAKYSPKNHLKVSKHQLDEKPSFHSFFPIILHWTLTKFFFFWYLVCLHFIQNESRNSYWIGRHLPGHCWFAADVWSLHWCLQTVLQNQTLSRATSNEQPCCPIGHRASTRSAVRPSVCAQQASTTNDRQHSAQSTGLRLFRRCMSANSLNYFLQNFISYLN